MQNSRELNVTHLKRPALVLARKSFLSNDEMTDTLIDLLNAMYPATTTGGSRGTWRAILTLLDKNGQIVGTRYIDFHMQLYLKYNQQFLPRVVFNPKEVSPSKVHFGYISDNNLHNYYTSKAWFEENINTSTETNVEKVKASNTETIQGVADAQLAVNEVTDESKINSAEGFSYKLYLFRREDHETLKQAMSTTPKPVKDALGNDTGKTRKGVLQEPSAYLGNQTPLNTVFVENKGPAIELGTESNAKTELQVIHNPSKIASKNKVMPEALSKYFTRQALQRKQVAYVWTFTLKPEYNLLILPRDLVHKILQKRKETYQSYQANIERLNKLMQDIKDYSAMKFIESGIIEARQSQENLPSITPNVKIPYLDSKINTPNIISVSSLKNTFDTGLATVLGAVCGLVRYIASDRPQTDLQKERASIEDTYNQKISELDTIYRPITGPEGKFVYDSEYTTALSKIIKERDDALKKFDETHPNINLSAAKQISYDILVTKIKSRLWYDESIEQYNINSLLYDKQMTTKSGQSYLRRLVLNDSLLTNTAINISRIDFKLRYYILLFKKILEKINEHYQYFIDRGILRIAPLEAFNQLKEFLENPQDIQVILNRNKTYNNNLKTRLPSFFNTNLTVDLKVSTKEKLCQLFENVLFNPWAGFYISTDYINKKYNSLYNITPQYNMFAQDTITEDALAYRNEDIDSISISRAANSASSATVSIKNKDEQYYILDSDEARAKYYKYIGTCVFEEMDELMIYLPKYYMSGSSSNTLDLCFRGIVEQVEYTNNAGYHSISLRAKCPIKLLEMSRTNIKPSFSTKNEANSMNNRIPYHVFSMPPEFLNSIPQAIAWMLTQGMTSVFCQPKIFNTQAENNKKLLSFVWIPNPEYEDKQKKVKELQQKSKSNDQKVKDQLATAKTELSGVERGYNQPQFSDPLFTYLWYVNNAGTSFVDRMIIDDSYKKLLDDYTATQYYCIEDSANQDRENKFQYETGIHIYKNKNSKLLLKNPTYYVFRYRSNNKSVSTTEDIDKLIVARLTGTYQPAFDIAFSTPDIRVSDYKTNYDILKEIADKYNFALYSDKAGIVTFCPINVSLFNLNSANGTRMPSTDKIIHTSNTLEDEEKYNPQVFTKERVISYKKKRDDSKIINWLVVNGQVPMVPGLDKQVGNVAIIQSRPLIRKYGVRAQKNYSLLGANGVEMCYCYGLSLMDRQNKHLVSAQIDAIFDSSFDINNPVYCTSDNTVYYADGLNISYKPGGSVTMSISCSYGRTPILKVTDYVQDKINSVTNTLQYEAIAKQIGQKSDTFLKEDYLRSRDYLDYLNSQEYKAFTESKDYQKIKEQYAALDINYTFNQNKFISAIKSLYINDVITPSAYSQLFLSANTYIKKFGKISNNYYFIEHVLPTIAFNGYIWDYVPSILFEDLIYDNLALYRGAQIAGAYLQTSENINKLVTNGQVTDKTREDRVHFDSPTVLGPISSNISSNQASLLNKYIINFISPWKTSGANVLFKAIEAPTTIDLSEVEKYIPGENTTILFNEEPSSYWRPE